MNSNHIAKSVYIIVVYATYPCSVSPMAEEVNTIKITE
jgi:hypothetical protein